MATWQDADFLDVRRPVSGNENKIAAILNDYKNWADSHPKSPLAYLQKQTQIPFYSDTSISKIRTDIARKTRGEGGSEKPVLTQEDRVFAARIFLMLAEEYDTHHSQIHKDFKIIEDMEKRLFDELKGEPDELFPLFYHRSEAENEDPGLYMTEERITNWFMIMMMDPLKSGVLVTDSRGVFDFLEEHSSSEKEIFSIDAIPVRQDTDSAMASYKDRLFHFLEESVVSQDPLSALRIPHVPEKCSGEAMLVLTGMRIPGTTPYNYFSGFFHDTDKPLIKKDNSRLKSTLICFLELVAG